MIGSESCLEFVTLRDMDIVVASTNIKLGEVLGILKSVYKFGVEWERVTILDHNFVEVAVILGEVRPWEILKCGFDWCKDFHLGTC